MLAGGCSSLSGLTSDENAGSMKATWGNVPAAASFQELRELHPVERIVEVKQKHERDVVVIHLPRYLVLIEQIEDRALPESAGHHVIADVSERGARQQIESVWIRRAEEGAESAASSPQALRSTHTTGTILRHPEPSRGFMEPPR
jgi:hypothetical protein